MSARCHGCEGQELVPVIDFGDVALAGAFLKPEAFATEKKYPLKIVYCSSCFLLQVEQHAPPDIIFGDHYFYFSSRIRTLREHSENYARELARDILRDGSLAVEVGCNDGVLLGPLRAASRCRLIGVDPSANVLTANHLESVELMHRFFSRAVADEIVEKHGKADLVVANNVMAHISDIGSVMDGVAHLLSDEGVFAFEVHYLGHLIEEVQYDMIYHEHAYYYSLLAAENLLARHGLVVFDARPIPIHAGSMRYYAKRRSSVRFPETDGARRLRDRELERGYDRASTYASYADRVSDSRTELLALLRVLHEDGRHAVAGYGASGRANTILQYCGITREHVRFIVDDAPAKQGFFTPGTHIPITSGAVLESSDIRFLLLFAWSFLDEVAGRNAEFLRRGGCFIVPLPTVDIVYWEDGAMARGAWRDVLPRLLRSKERSRS